MRLLYKVWLSFFGGSWLAWLCHVAGKCCSSHYEFRAIVIIFKCSFLMFSWSGFIHHCNWCLKRKLTCKKTVVSMHGSLREKLIWLEGPSHLKNMVWNKKSQKLYKQLRTEINSQVMSDVGFLIINHPAAWIAFTHNFFSIAFSSHCLKLGDVTKLSEMQMEWVVLTIHSFFKLLVVHCYIKVLVFHVRYINLV